MRALLLVFVLICGASSAAVDPGDFLSLAFDPSVAALGDAADVVTPGPLACLRNPGILAAAPPKSVALAHTFLSLERRMDAGAVAFPLGERGVVAVGGVQASVDRIDGRDTNGRHTGYVSDTRNAVSFAFAFRVNPAVGVGLGVKALFREMAGETSSGSAFDVGVRVGLTPRLGLGVAGRNLGLMRPRGRPMGAYWPWTTSFWSDELQVQKNDRIPPALTVAASVAPVGKLVVGVALTKTEAEAATLSGGVEYPVDDRLILRAGGTAGSPSVGGAFLVPLPRGTLRVEYAYRTGELTGDAIHHVSMSSRFGQER